MENNSQGVPATRANRAYPVAQMGTVITPRAAHRTMVDGKDHRVALVRREHLDARLPARLLLGEDEFAACKISTAFVQKGSYLKREEDIAVQVPVQAIIIAGAVLQHQRCRPFLACAVTLLAEVG